MAHSLLKRAQHAHQLQQHTIEVCSENTEGSERLRSFALAAGDWWCVVVGPKVSWGTSAPVMSLVWVAGGNRDHLE